MADFNTDLQATKTMAKKELAERVLQKMFPNSPIKWNVADGNDSGIDLWVDQRAIDVKYRKNDPVEDGEDDICLEIWSHCEKRIKGWTLDDKKLTNYILWIWGNTGRHELIPFRELRMAFEINGKKWCKKYGTQTQTQYNRNYTSQSVFVPREVIYSAIKELYWSEENENQ